MRYLRALTIVVLSLVLLAGCAQKQEDAERLEQELIAKESLAVAESIANAGAIPPETKATDSVVADAKAVPQETDAFQADQAPASGFTVQVAACEDLEYARHLVDLYIERGYEPYLTNTVQEGITFYRVRIGGFDSYNEAKALQGEIIDRFSAPVWIDAIE